MGYGVIREENLNMPKRILMVLAPDQYRDEELNVPRNAFVSEGWTVDLASTQKGTAQGMLGDTEEVTMLIGEADAERYDAIVVVGGMGSPTYLWNNPDLNQLLQTMDQQGRVIGAICLSGAVPGLAGIARGKKATVWETPDSRAALENNGAIFTDEPVTQDGRLITANGPDAAEDFARLLVAQIKALTPA